MQEARKNFTFPPKFQNHFCEICISTRWLCILLYEVRYHERGRKEIPELGSGRPQTSGDSFRSPGKPGQINGIEPVKRCHCEPVHRLSHHGFALLRNDMCFLFLQETIIYSCSIEPGEPKGCNDDHCTKVSHWPRAHAHKKTGPPKRSCFLLFNYSSN